MHRALLIVSVIAHQAVLSRAAKLVPGTSDARVGELCPLQIVDPPPSRRPPLDLSLKTQLTFTSDHSFEEVEAAGTEPGAPHPERPFIPHARRGVVHLDRLFPPTGS